jgi:hypothetical protein
MLKDLLTTNGLKLNLPGSHATVFAWMPPEGVPLAILQRMRFNLMDALADYAQSSAALRSARTSPTPSRMELPNGPEPLMMASSEEEWARMLRK